MSLASVNSNGQLAGAPPSDAHRWRRNLRLYPWFYFFHDLQVWMPIWIIFSTQHIGLNFSQLGLIGPFFYLILSVGQAPAGALADRFGRANASSSVARARRSARVRWRC